VRPAEEADIPELLVLTKDYLDEQQDFGGDVLPTPRTIDYYRTLFAGVIGKTIMGAAVALSWNGSLVGFHLTVELPMPWDSMFGRAALGFGTFVDPAFRGRGFGVALREVANDLLREAGFETVIGLVHTGNQPGEQSLERCDWKWVGRMGYKRLVS